MDAERPFGGGRRPPYVPQYGNADLTLICREAGLEPARYATQDFISTQGMWALIELFADGEIIVQPEGMPIAANVDPEVRHGEFYAKIAQLWQHTQNEPGSALDNEFNKLARFCGTIYAHTTAGGRNPIGLESEVQVDISRPEPAIRYAGYRLKINPGMSVMDIGPGIAGKQFIELQANLLKRGAFVQYLTISRGPFVNQFLVDYGKEIFMKDPRLPNFEEIVRHSLFIGREDGVLSALEEILSTQQPSGRHDNVDLVICNGVGTANREEFIKGLELVPHLVKPEGRLLLGAPVEEIHDEGPRFDDGWKAVSDKFVTVRQVTKRSGSALLGRTTTSTYAVLQRRAA